MDRNHFCSLTLCLVIATSCLGSAFAQAPAPRTYPPEAYYVGLAAMRDGATGDAAEFFERAVRSGRTDINGKWVDSIPAFAMLGECHYQLGNLRQAHQSFDAAIELMIRHRSWLTAVQWPQTMPGGRAAIGVGTWAASTRRSTLAAVPDQMSIMIGSHDIEGQLRSGGPLQTAQLMRIDVAEILRTLAWSLYRRTQILGGLSIDDPLTEQAITTFEKANVPPGPGHAWIDLCLALAYIADNQAKQAVPLAERAVSFPGNLDHPLTPICLLTVANLLTVAGNPAASSLHIEAALSAAAFEQYEVTAEALLIGAGPLAGEGSGAMFPKAAGAALQLGRKSRLVSAAGYLVAAESAAIGGAAVDSSRALADANSVLSRRNVVLPRLEAYANYCVAVLAYRTGDRSGAASVDKALAFAFGKNQPASPHVYQLALVQSAIGGGKVGARTADELLASLSGGPSLGHWYRDPVDALAATRNSQALDEARFGALISRTKGPEALQAADLLLGNRFRSALPLSGRMLDVRWLASGDDAALSEEARTMRAKPPAWLKPLLTRSTEMTASQKVLSGLPFETEDAQQAARLKNVWGDLAKLAEQAEGLVDTIAIRRTFVPRLFPPAIGDDSMWPKLSGDTAMIAFCPSGSSLYALMLHHGKVTAWQVQRPTGLLPQIAKLTKTLGLGRRRGGTPQLSPPEDWYPLAEALRNQLFAGIKAPTLQQLRRIVIVPYGTLWYLPFELLPVGEGDGPRLGDSMEISYAATPGLALRPPALSATESLNSVVAGRFFSPSDPEINEELALPVIEAIDDTVRLPGKSNMPGSIIASRFGRVTVAAAIKPGGAAPLSISPFAYDRGTGAGSLAAWMRYPWGAPGEVLLPGLQSNISGGGKPTGDELFVTACGLQAAGARHLLISRWAVGGVSTASLLTEYLSEAEFSTPPQSWKRSVLLLRNQELDPAQEPLLSDGDIKAGPASGSHPLFWAGYMMFGNELK